ncbi:MAG: DUF3769 domain-containing protein [Pseudanabaenaceae cyanobacterium SKYGB_i_bin29]|nr:DUF3769 domain-containing protein [Pseudanabaenaceae cyanobacterium SKYG29]MDW8421027.1 DUF3769 domain-containing protein [Pseudanabaenaceae cyanobacterium SKYGB_i_bin29]
MQTHISPPPSAVVILAREQSPRVFHPREQEHWVQFFCSFPSLEFRALTAQAGPIKPGLPIEPKPTDPKPIRKTPQPEQLVNVKANEQRFDVKTNTITVSGNVVITYQESELRADQVTLNLTTRETTAQGNVLFTRGEQKIAGESLTYNYGTRQGKLIKARGTVNLDTINRPPSAVTSSDIASGSVVLAIGGAVAVQRRGVRRLGFVADEITLNDRTWTGKNVRVTNDAFSPPELELVTPQAKLSPSAPTQDVLELESPRLAFDRVLSIPLPLNQITLDSFDSEFPVLIGFDRQERGGIFYQQNFDIVRRPDLKFQISPQLFVQRSLETGNIFSTSVVGVTSRLEVVLPEGQYIGGRASLSGFDLNNIGNELRWFVDYSRPVGELTFKAQYAYRERFFNGSLGLQDVPNSFGVSLFSPTYTIPDSDIKWQYQAGLQLVDADRADLPKRDVLLKQESVVALNRSFPLWRGQALPPTADQGLRYSPEPIVPQVDAVVGLTGAYSIYSSGDVRSFITGTAGLSATLGNYSRDFLDYTKLDLRYSQTEQAGNSPFLFDRIADKQVITAGIKQQLFGPIRIGYQQSWNPITGRITDSVYTLELERRSFAVILRINPQRETGEIFLRISDFNWNAPPGDKSP